MKRRLLRVITPMIMMAFAGTLAYAQGGVSTTTLSGIVTDSSGAVLPGADVVVKNNATTVESRAVTDSKGEFVVAGLVPGSYTLTVSLMGFKTVVLPDVTINPGAPATIKPVVLEVGKLEETVTVTGATELCRRRRPRLPRR